MKLQRWGNVGAVVATLTAPLGALAQPVTASVTTAPGATAPAVGMPMLVLLAVGLGVGAVYAMQRRTHRASATLAMIAALTVLSGIAYANLASVVVSGGQCGVQTTQTWTDNRPYILDNRCSNPLLIVAIVNTCPTPGVFTSPCIVGQTLAAGAICNLPDCE